MEIIQLNYGIAVSDESKETEIVILMSPGQSGHTSLHVICMGVDGGIIGLDDIVASFKYGELEDKRHFILGAIDQALLKIRRTFKQPYSFLTEDDITTIQETIIDMYHL